MNPKVKDDIVAVLDNAVDILEIREPKDLYELRELSNHVIHNAGIFQDEDSISVAVIIYALYKILERMPFLEHRNYSRFFQGIKNARDSLRKDDLDSFHSEMKAIFRLIETLDSRLKIFVQEVITKARINKGSKLVSHGISVAQAASLMGISQWELMSYVGKTEIVDRDPFKDDARKRLAFARKLFG